MRILMVNHEFTISGSSTAFFRLALHLRGCGHALTVFPCNPADGPMKQRYADAAIEIDSSVLLTDFDLAIGNTICAAPALLRIGQAMPTVWFVNEAEVALELLLKNPNWIEAFKQVTAVIFNTAFQHDVFRSFTYNLDAGKFHTIPFGVDLDPNGLARDRVPAKTAALRVVQVGAIEPRKRPGDLIQAVKNSRLDVELVICGQYHELHAVARAWVDAEPARFRLLSGLPDAEVLCWVESADIFCLASSSETQALAAYEAALLARPLLLSDLRCYRDIFRHGHNCLLFPAGHIEMLTRSIGMLGTSPALRLQLGQAAQRTARRFTNRRFFAQFDALLQELGEAG